MLYNQFKDLFFKFKKLNLSPINSILEIYLYYLNKSDNDLIKNILIDYNIILYKDFLNDIFIYYLKNDTLLSINTYYRYYNEKKLINWIIDLSDINKDINNKKILDGNVKINSFIECIYNKYGIINIDGISNNNIINKLCELNINYYYNDKFKLLNYDILINGIDNYDYIFYDFPIGIHNMTHASCCSKIKNLKIRGTKVESLLLQLIMMSLNKNGRALLIIPDSILYGDSNQQIMTRKYLLENFNIINIIKLDESFYKIKNTKNSILYFTNTGKTNKISFNKLSYDLELDNIIDVEYNIILNNNYSLFYKHYINISNSILSYKSIIDYCKIYNNINDIELDTNISNNIITLNKYYKDDNSINLELNKDGYIFINCKNIYILNYIYTIIKTNINLYTTGKLLKFDIDKILTINIPDLSEDKQNTIINYINISNNIIIENNKKIEMYKELQKYLLNSLPNPKLLLNNITIITNNYESNLIGLIKNGLSAGTIYLNNTEILNINSYYLKLINNNYNFKFIYYYLKYIEYNIKEECKLSSQPLLTLNILSNIKIPDINKDIQDDIVNKCDDIDSNINKFYNDNINIKNKNIIDLILKLY